MLKGYLSIKEYKIRIQENNTSINPLPDMKLNYKYQGYLSLLPTCSVINGKSRSIVLDTTSNNFDIIPNELAFIIEKSTNGLNLESIYSDYGDNNLDVIDSYIDFLVKKGYGLVLKERNDSFRDNQEMFSEWDTPFRISNAIIDYDTKLTPLYNKALAELGQIGCDILQVRFLQNEELPVIEKFLDLVYSSGQYNGVSLVADILSTHLVSDALLENLVSKYPLISEIVLYNSVNDNFFENDKYRFKVLHIKGGIDVLSCGAVLPFYFGSNTTSYSESLHHNTCLNRKISIDIDGNIKNCPSMQECFGNIRSTTLEEAMGRSGFKRYWNITKDQVSICKDCEFRRVCTDCRAYLDDPQDLYSKPLKCGYDPYTCKWEDWSTHPMKQKAIDYYGMHDHVKKR